MRIYLEFALKKFQNKMVYRVDFFMGIINTIITIVVYLCIYRALYGTSEVIDGVSYDMVATNFVIALGLSQAFAFNEMLMPDKIIDGSIANELLKPVNFKLRLLSENVGEGVFNIIFRFLPSLLFTCMYTRLCPPKSVVSLALMFISVVLGYLILWLISFIVQTWCFWLFSVWGVVVIKNVFINIFSGSLLPLWFMPNILRRVVAFTPFASIYFTPIQIYLGEIKGVDILTGMLVQVVWIAVLYMIGNVFWKMGVRKLVVQGG